MSDKWKEILALIIGSLILTGIVLLFLFSIIF